MSASMRRYLPFDGQKIWVRGTLPLRCIQPRSLGRRRATAPQSTPLRFHVALVVRILPPSHRLSLLPTSSSVRLCVTDDESSQSRLLGVLGHERQRLLAHGAHLLHADHVLRAETCGVGDGRETERGEGQQHERRGTRNSRRKKPGNNGAASAGWLADGTAHGRVASGIALWGWHGAPPPAHSPAISLLFHAHCTARPSIRVHRDPDERATAGRVGSLSFVPSLSFADRICGAA